MRKTEQAEVGNGPALAPLCNPQAPVKACQASSQVFSADTLWTGRQFSALFSKQWQWEGREGTTG